MSVDNRQLRKRLSSIKTLPTLSMVANTVINLTQNPDSTAFEIAEAISKDQALATRVLKTANSAYYGFPEKITTINYATVVLGLNNIKNIVLSASIMDRFSKSGPDHSLDRNEFWKHAVLCGIISKRISRLNGMKNAEEMFMCGLLHDFGKLILDLFFHDEFIDALALAKDKEISLLEAEHNIFGFNHSGVGALLLKKWSLPPSLVKAVEFHHAPEDSPNMFRIAAIVHVSDYLSHRISSDPAASQNLPVLNKKAFALTDLKPDQIKKMSVEIIKEFQDAIQFLYREEESA